MRRISGYDLVSFLLEESLVNEADIVGSFDASIMGFCSLNNPKTDCICWVKHPTDGCLDVLIPLRNMVVVASQPIECASEGVRFVVTKEPKAVFFRVLNQFWGEKTEPRISLDSVVETTQIGKNVSVGHHCYIGPDVVLCDNVTIDHNVSIVSPATIGPGTRIHSGVVIGTDGFGYYDNSGVPTKVDHFGGVRIGSDVEIGANACIDRGTIDDTVIGDNVKIDDLSIVGHNAVIGDNSLIIHGAICGSAKIGKGVQMAPNSVVKNQITIGDNVLIGLGAVVMKDVANRLTVAGNPARGIKKND